MGGEGLFKINCFQKCAPDGAVNHAKISHMYGATGGALSLQARHMFVLIIAKLSKWHYFG